jgi:hypothetical protein
VLAGMLQKTVMMSLPAIMATAGSQYFDQEIGGLTPQQRQRLSHKPSTTLWMPMCLCFRQ